MGEILTIGHSTHVIEHFLSLLSKHGATAVADVRSVPASRFTPQFNRDALKRSLADVDIKYVFLGKELGARSDDRSCYIEGQVQYDRLAQTVPFGEGIERLLNGATSERIAILCAEQEPLDCHRTVLVSRVLAERGASVAHIHGDGLLESHDVAMQRLMSGFGLDQDDLFHTREELLGEALARQEQRIAYVDKDLSLGEVQPG
ncbi:DUF488 domain-containing protein [Nocardioides allogilvus]|uniref:DUF488 domain-containing protein n=1 Tax=Nocardioides allogilvus TaxID=2072017 RepID=UPI000D2FBC55|nr:DUF488 domain-containing protein [Nocardioides allogilvus]